MSCFRVRDSSNRLREMQAEAVFRRLQITVPGTDLAFTSVATDDGNKRIVGSTCLARPILATDHYDRSSSITPKTQPRSRNSALAPSNPSVRSR